MEMLFSVLVLQFACFIITEVLYVQFVGTGEYLLRNMDDALTVNDLS